MGATKAGVMKTIQNMTDHRFIGPQRSISFSYPPQQSLGFYFGQEDVFVKELTSLTAARQYQESHLA